MFYLIGNKAVYLKVNLKGLKKERNARIHRTYCLMGWCFLLFEEYNVSAKKKKSVFILKPCQEEGQHSEESLQGGRLVKKLEIL